MLLNGKAKYSIHLATLLMLAATLFNLVWADEPANVQPDITPEARDAVDRLRRFAANAPSEQRKIVCVYFTPSDRTPIPDYRERLARLMKDMQRFYGKEMARHGLGNRSIQFELDAKGALVIHDVKGLHPAADYLGRDQKKGYGIRDEARPVLTAAGINDQKETIIYFCHLRTEQDGHVTGIGPYYGSGAQRGAFRWGHCWFTDATILDPDKMGDKTTMVDDEEYHHISVGRYNSHFIGGALHELGHALRLPHDKERKDESVRGRSLMGSGNHTYGEELRNEGKGTFLTLSDALQLASHPMFSGTTRDLDVKPECKMEDLHAELRDGKLEISGHIVATPQPYALIAYNDPFGGGIVDAKGWHDYGSTTWTAPLDSTDRFTVRIGEFKRGGANIRLVVCHVNGATSSFRYPLEVNEDGTPNPASIQFNTAPAR